MPVKFKENQVVIDKATGKKHVQRFHMNATALKELLDTFTRGSTTPKLRAKIRNELVRRNVEIPTLES
jgi:hypothetical protein